MPHFWPCSVKSGAQYVCVYYDARDTFSPFPVPYICMMGVAFRARVLQKYKSYMVFKFSIEKCVGNGCCVNLQAVEFNTWVNKM